MIIVICVMFCLLCFSRSSPATSDAEIIRRAVRGLDYNNDSVIGSDELLLYVYFIDKDGSNTVTKREFLVAWSYRVQDSCKQLIDVFKNLDVNDDRFISVQDEMALQANLNLPVSARLDIWDFYDFWTSSNNQLCEKASSVFRSLDENNNELLEMRELNYAFNLFDSNDDNTVSVQEMENFLLRNYV